MGKNLVNEKPRKRKMTMENPNDSVVFHCHVSFSGEVFQTTRKLDLLRSIFERVGNPLRRKNDHLNSWKSIYVCLCMSWVSMIFCRPFLALPSSDEDKNSSYILQVSTSFSQKKIEAVFEDVLCFSAGTKPERWLRVKHSTESFYWPKKKVVPPG